MVCHGAMDTIAPPPELLTRTGQLADRIAGTLRMARALALNRRDIDLDGLDNEVGKLCARALDLPPDQGRQFRPRLVGLLADLDALSIAMRT
jgi:hypothetical protein